MPESRPNIILLMTDQQKASATSIYGNRVVRTPNWESVAADGITFDNCFSCSPVCTPSRASIMTGTHVPAHGGSSNSHTVAEGLVQLPELLRDAGYETGVVGHHDGFAGLNRGWDCEIDWWDKKHGLVQIFYVADELSKTPQPVTGWVSGPTPHRPEEGLAARMTDHALEFIENAREPFFLHLAHLEPHPPYFAPEPYASMYPPEVVDLPAEPDGSLRPAWQAEAAEELNCHLATDEDKRLALARYYGNVSYADDQIGRLVSHLEATGQLDHTWIVVASDHGDYTGEHGLFCKSHAMYDCLLHVPLVVRPPSGSGFAAGVRETGMVQLLDLFPTFLGLAGLTPPEHCQGRDLLDNPGRDHVFAAVGGIDEPRASFPQGMPKRGIHRELLTAVRTRSRKFVLDPENGDELYDLERDPGELSNLILGGERVPADLAEALEQWREECARIRPQ